jgi:phage terminase large subunit GpA-like protein
LTTTATWFLRESAIWEPPRRMTVSEWADEHRIIGRGSSKPGRWSTPFVEFTREIMDTFVDPEVAEVTILKSAQTSGTEMMLNILGYVIDQDPSPSIYVMPRDEDWAYIRTERVGPMLEETPALARHITSTATDLSKGTLRFDRCSVFFAGAGSAASRASRSAWRSSTSWTSIRAGPVRKRTR